MSMSHPKGQSPLYMSLSIDGGRRWGVADPVAPTGIYPGSILLENSVVAVSYGRPGNRLMFSKDEGQSWGPIVPYYHDLFPTDGSNYQAIVEVAPNILLVAYARTDPNDHWYSEVAATYFKVIRTDEQDETTQGAK